MIILGMPLFGWLGVFLLISLFVQVYFGTSMSKGKFYFKAHKILASIIILLALVHGVLAFLFMSKGISI